MFPDPAIIVIDGLIRETILLDLKICNVKRQRAGLKPIPAGEWFKAIDMASDFCLEKDRPWTWKNKLAAKLITIFKLDM